MIFLAQFGINTGTRKFFKDYKLHSPYGLVQFFVDFEKFTRAYLFQIALEIIWLPIQTFVSFLYMVWFNQSHFQPKAVCSVF